MSLKPHLLARPIGARALLCLLLLTLGGSPLKAITIKGSNGKAVEFHTIEGATPKGLTAKMSADGAVIGITWDKIDLEALALEHPDIFAAYQKTTGGESVTLGMSDAAPGAAAGAAAAAPPKYPGWVEVQSGKIEFMLQLPQGEPRGLLLLSLDDYGAPFQWLRIHERGSGVWSEFQNKHSFALLTYDANPEHIAVDPTAVMPFMAADKGSGAALLAALKSFETKLKKPGLAELPIAVFGSGRTGAAFAYNFIHWKPERILAAALCQGAFYDAAPTESSVAVPIAFVWGQYDNRPELWHSENGPIQAHAKGVPMKSVWTSAMEFRAPANPSPVSEHFGKQYLLETIPTRMPKEPAAPPAAAPDASAEKPAEGTPAAAPEVAPAPPAAPEIPPLRREAGMVGNLETGETTNLSDAGRVLGEDETFLPNAKIAELWKKLLNGELEPPLPKAQ